jgi:hypothetical protein
MCLVEDPCTCAYPHNIPSPNVYNVCMYHIGALSICLMEMSALKIKIIINYYYHKHLCNLSPAQKTLYTFNLYKKKTTDNKPSYPTLSACNRTTDVIFVMDASSSVGSSNLATMMSAVQTASRYFLNDVTRNSSVRLMTYSSDIRFDLGPVYTASDLQTSKCSVRLYVCVIKCTSVYMLP